jgi:class 3 adenylate cyclase
MKRLLIFLALNFLLSGSIISLAQDQKIADSLIKKLKEHQRADKDSLRLYLLSDISFYHQNPDSALYYARLLQKETEDPHYLYSAHYNEGSALRMQGNLDGALEAYFKSLELAIIVRNTGKKEAIANMAIGDVYSISGAHNNAVKYYSKCIDIYRKLSESLKSVDSLNLATALFNAGDEYLTQDSLKVALPYFKESGNLFEHLGYTAGLAYNLGNMGMLYAKQGDDDKAMFNINKAVEILEEAQDYYAISEYLTYMSEIYLNRGNTSEALEYAKRSLQLAKKYGLKDQIGDSNLLLSELYEKQGDQITAYKYYKDHIVYRDSVQNVAKVQEMADLRTNFEVSQKQTELDLKETALNLSNQQKKNQRIVILATATALFLIGLLAVGLFRRNKFIQRTKKIIEEEKNRSDNLLLNILPEETAQELKDSGKVKAKKYESVTVFFSDFKGFTSYSETLSPEALVETIGYYFSKFDVIIEKYGLEKIKTIGDAYMCAGGLPFPSDNHAENMIRAAMEIADFVAETKKDVNAKALNFDIRIGINTGPVVAGVVGAKKFAYDIWGDTVNIASRMESASEPGKINISENTYEIIKGNFDCEYRGQLDVKNKGKMKMYFVNKLKESL